jgi:RNA polymerase sigma-70 factor (ECF subfamily)
VNELWTDEALLAAARAGCPEAFGTLAARYCDALSAFARRYVRDADDAGDVVQEALLRAYQHMRSLERGRSFRPWLFAIARNASFDVLKYRKRANTYLELDDRFPASEQSPEETALRDDDARSVRRALAALPEPYRAVLELYYLSGLRYREIAVALGVPIGTVKTHISRAKERLRNELVDEHLEWIA